jgi:HAD superfamily hydrolase (TIGR01509 family)
VELIRAVLFDLDGTLFRHNAMRLLMALELAGAACRQPARAGRLWRVLGAYRKMQEDLRKNGTGTLAGLQVEATAARTGIPAGEVAAMVDEWMFRRPLKHMRRCSAPGLSDLLAFLEGNGLALGVLSDYPPHAKLEALGVSERFSLILCSTDPEIGAFKPNPRGFLYACRQWKLEPRDVLVVGDRVSVDAAAARAAGMPCVIVGRSQRIQPSADYMTVPSLASLSRILAKTPQA